MATKSKNSFESEKKNHDGHYIDRLDIKTNKNKTIKK